MDEVIKSFEKSFEDLKFSRAEKQALNQLISEKNLKAYELDLVRKSIFKIAKENSKSYESKELIDWLESSQRTLTSVDPKTVKNEAYFSPGEDCLEAIQNKLKSAKKEIDICVFTITDNRISGLLRYLFQKGIKIRIITDNDKAEDRGSDVDSLSELGIAVRTDNTSNHMHHKFALIDRSYLITGSYNWTRSAEHSNHENIIISNDLSLVNSFSEEFEKIWNEMMPIGKVT